MRKRSIPAIGVPTLVLLLVTLSLAILASLSAVSARSDKKLAERSAAVAEEIYALYAEAEGIRAEIDTAVTSCNYQGDSAEELCTEIVKNLPDCVHSDGNMLYFSVIGETKTVTCTVLVETGAGVPVLSFSRTVSLR